MKNTKAIPANNITPTTKTKIKVFGKKQAGFTILDFAFWMALAAIGLVGITQIYKSVTAGMNESAVATDFVQIRTAVDGWKGTSTNLTGVSMAKICAVGYGNTDASWCGANNDGKKANAYGGDYTLTVSANVSQVDITVKGVDARYVKSLGNTVASASAGRCKQLDGCATTVATADSVKVTM
ncbi:hypothetical protein [Moritella viscosa]|uniref:Uncharacterized protein n=1 Tax=Moritella viscosa TaxID=80854 RepID=A0ABY1HMP8_9GAMM|nr:hypothetical protein [Moritella viscosa]SGZ04455.1 Putative uncharacterized protein [Moritella viscosa]